MQWSIDWNKGNKKDHRGPRSSHYWTVDGYVVAASGMLKDAVGLPHVVVARELWVKGFPIQFVSTQCVPTTQKYHKELAANVDAFLALLNERKAS